MAYSSTNILFATYCLSVIALGAAKIDTFLLSRADIPVGEKDNKQTSKLSKDNIRH